MEQRWYVVQTQAQRETRAEANLRRQGFHTYLPRYLRTRRHARRVEMVARPLFPRYMFVAFNAARDSWRSVRSTYGVSDLVAVGTEPVPVPEGIVEEIRAREGEQGYVQLGLPPGVGPGSAVRLIDSLFSDYRGVLARVADGRRVEVLLEFLGREVRVLVPAASISAA